MNFINFLEWTLCACKIIHFKFQFSHFFYFYFFTQYSLLLWEKIHLSRKFWTKKLHFMFLLCSLISFLIYFHVFHNKMLFISNNIVVLFLFEYSKPSKFLFFPLESHKNHYLHILFCCDGRFWDCSWWMKKITLWIEVLCKTFLLLFPKWRKVIFVESNDCN